MSRAPLNEELFLEKLKSSFPEMFSNPGALELCSIPPGWQKHVYDLCACITAYTKNTTLSRPKTCLRSKLVRLKNSVFRSMLNGGSAVFAFLKRPDLPYTTLLLEKCERRFYRFCNSVIWKRGFPLYESYTPPAVTVEQIKEKFGSLRFYYNGGNDQIAGMVAFAEHLCGETCQETGKPGSLYVKSGWYQCLNHKYAEKYGYVKV